MSASGVGSTEQSRLREFITGQSSSDITIISIGSAGDDLQQICPRFAKEASRSQSVTIINLDVNFDKEQEKDLELSSENLDVFKYKYTVRDSHLQNQGLMATLDEIIQDPKKKLVIINHMSPDIQDWTATFMKAHLDKMGNNLEYIGSYFQDIPVVRYKEALFRNYTPLEINQIALKLWSKWRNAFDRNLTPQQYNTMTTSELNILREMVEPYGILYRNLEKLPYQDLFIIGATPASIEGLSEEEHFQYIEKLAADLDPSAPIVDAAEKNLLPVVIALFNDGVSLDSTNRYMRTPLMQATIKGNQAVVEWLLSNGADPLKTDHTECTALDFCIWNDQVDIAIMLIKHNPNVLQGEAWTKATNFAREKNSEELTQLIKGICRHDLQSGSAKIKPK